MMTKEACMTFRVEADLREQFAEAAGRAHRPAAQVLRDFMRAYVERAQAPRPSAGIGEAERQRRQDAVNYGWASVGLEGFSVSPAAREHGRRFIEGEIDLHEFANGFKEYDELRQR
jgi:predicted transcriptional regulator